MKTITKEFPRNDIYPIETITKGYTPVLFDIETTGLSAATSYLYLIGALEIKKDRLIFIQWFAEKPSEELELLDRFFAWLPDTACLIHFNGRGFDIPYISKKCHQYDIRNTLPQMPNIDLYRSFAPLKDYFDMTSRKLVAYEKLIGLNREDIYNGGELIDVYKEYVGKSKFDENAAKELFDMLVLHNEEDIKDMVPVLSLFTYMDMLGGGFESYSTNIIEETQTSDSTTNKKLEIKLIFKYPFPISYSKELATMPGIDMIKVNTHDSEAVITIPIVNARLKHYYDDFRNYYYLPAEDMAIHKSVAAGVDANYREPATKATAYTYAKGEFIPQTGTVLKPFFKNDLADRISFIPIKNLKDNTSVSGYVKALF